MRGKARLGGVIRSITTRMSPLSASATATGSHLPLVEMHGDILVRGERRPMLASCMDQCMVDVTGMEVQIGEEVTLFGFDREGNALLSQDVANFCGANEGARSRALLAARGAHYRKLKADRPTAYCRRARFLLAMQVNYNYSVGRARI